MSMRSPYQTLFIMSFSFNRCINAWRRKLWGMHLVCIKYELMYSDAKSKDRFISATLSSAVRTLGWGEGHVVVLMVAWSWFGQCTNLLTASWGSESPFSSTLSIHESKGSWGKKENKPSSFTSRTQTPFYPSYFYLLSHSLKDLIHLCAGTAPQRQLCTSKPLRLPLSISILQPVCLSSLPSGWTSQRKNWWNIPFALLELPECTLWMIQLLRTQWMKTTVTVFRNLYWWEQLKKMVGSGTS